MQTHPERSAAPRVSADGDWTAEAISARSGRLADLLGFTRWLLIDRPGTARLDQWSDRRACPGCAGRGHVPATERGQR